MKFYIASSLSNHKQVCELAALLKAAGWQHTYDWTANLSSKEINCEMLKEIGINELAGVKDADAVIILTPQGRGTHTELGMAIALDKKVFLCHSDDKYFKCNDDTCSFYWLPQVTKLVGSVDEIAKEVLKAE